MSIRKDSRLNESRTTPLPKPVFLWHAMQNDIDIFRGIKSEIQKNPENFKPVGQWLNGYCQNVIKKAKQHRKNLPQIISEKQKEAKRIKGLHGKTRKESSKLKDQSEINEQEEDKLSGLVAKANQLSLKEYDLKRELEHLKGKSQDEPGFIQLMSKAFEKASCEYPRNHIKIMVIVWLLTDEYLSESKLGITKYEQYVFHHEVREPEGNGPQRLVSEQEMAKDAVLARPGAMEKIRDAYLSYQGLFPGESIGTAVQQTPADLNGGKADTKPLSKDVEVQYGSDTPVTLREFMREYCEPLTKNLLESRVLALQGLNQKHKLKPPLETVAKIYKPGQSHKFLPSFLRANWPKYIEKLSSLPKLK